MYFLLKVRVHAFIHRTLRVSVGHFGSMAFEDLALCCLESKLKLTEFDKNLPGTYLRIQIGFCHILIFGGSN